MQIIYAFIPQIFMIKKISWPIGQWTYFQLLFLKILLLVVAELVLGPDSVLASISNSLVNASISENFCSQEFWFNNDNK
jgi:hypothetical protein